jgi:two-component system sensor histidine kinase HydH
MQNLAEATTPEIKNVSTRGGTADFVRHLAHELRQPLSTIESIACYLDLVLPPTAVNVREQVAKLQILVEQSSWIVSNAVDFVQATPVNPVKVDLNQMLFATMAMLDDGAPQVAADGLRNTPAVRIDRAQAEHLMRNLLVFLQHAGAGHPISFHAAVDSSSGLVVLEACAPAGQSPQCLDMLFEPFNSGLPPGLGLGMASMVRIVEAHGGWARTSAGDGLVTIQIALPPA